MELAKLEEYKDATGIALLNAYNNGSLSREDYQLVQRFKRSRLDDPAEFLRSVLPATVQECAEDVGSTKNVESTENVPPEDAKYVESTRKVEPTKNEMSLSALAGEYLKKGGAENVESTKSVLSVGNPRSSLETGSYEDTEGSLPVLSNVTIRANFTKLDNDVSDLLNRLQTPVEQSIYHRLYRLSVGWGRNHCRVGSKALLSACNIKDKRTLNAGLDGLIEKGHIKPINRNNKGVMYRVFFPQEIFHDDSKTAIEIVGVTDSDCGTRDTNKGGTKYVDSTENVGSTKNVDSTEIPPNKDIIKHNIKDTLSLDDIVDIFYTGIGQARISEEKRERAIKCIEELKADGFSEDDVAYAAQWTPDNATEKLYDFSILKHTIGQALAARAKEEAEEEARRERARVAAELEAEEARERQERDRLDDEKSKLAPEERKRLRIRAEQELRDSGNYKAELVTEALISTKENQILREEGIA